MYILTSFLLPILLVAVTSTTAVQLFPRQGGIGGGGGAPAASGSGSANGIAISPTTGGGMEMNSASAMASATAASDSMATAVATPTGGGGDGGGQAAAPGNGGVGGGDVPNGNQGAEPTLSDSSAAAKTTGGAIPQATGAWVGIGVGAVGMIGGFVL
ncbi:MAG: hypothetical protein Q9167_001867 [Letrouitia subvulpina]